MGPPRGRFRQRLCGGSVLVTIVAPRRTTSNVQAALISVLSICIQAYKPQERLRYVGSS
jgi:hypothetical protein